MTTNSKTNTLSSISMPIMIFCDNTTTIFYSNNDKINNASKHMGIKYYTIEDLIKLEMS